MMMVPSSSRPVMCTVQAGSTLRESAPRGEKEAKCTVKTFSLLLLVVVVIFRTAITRLCAKLAVSCVCLVWHNQKRRNNLQTVFANMSDICQTFAVSVCLSVVTPLTRCWALTVYDSGTTAAAAAAAVCSATGGWLVLVEDGDDDSIDWLTGRSITD